MFRRKFTTAIAVRAIHVAESSTRVKLGVPHSMKSVTMINFRAPYMVESVSMGDIPCTLRCDSVTRSKKMVSYISFVFTSFFFFQHTGDGRGKIRKKGNALHWFKLLLYWLQMAYYVSVGGYDLIDGHADDPYKCEFVVHKSFSCESCKSEKLREQIFAEM